MTESGILAKALYTNTPEAKNELFFRKGDILSVIQFDFEGQMGWWLCSLRGEKGLCPGNYLEVLKDDHFPIYTNEVSRLKEDEEDLQQTYDVPRSHNPVAVTRLHQSPDLYDIPPSSRHYDNDARSTRSPSQSLMSSGTLSHYSSSSSSARSSDICDTPGGNHSDQRQVPGGEFLSLPGKNDSASVRSSGISSEAGASLEDCYDIPRSAKSEAARFSKSSSSVLTDDSIDVYDVPRSSFDECDRPPSSSHSEIPGLIERIQLRNKSNTISAAGNRRAQFISDHSNTNGFRKSFCSSGNGKLSFSSPFSHSIDATYSNKEDRPSSRPPSNHFPQLRKPASSIYSSSDTMSISSDLRKAQGSKMGFASVASQESLGGADVKILPLTPKAAVSVCEKMRQEVMTGISSVLIFVKPKWRSSANLAEIIPDLRFGCVRLNLAIKDFAEFCSRAVSNAKNLGNDVLIAKMRRLLTPINTSSQMIQQSVNELEAYFWSAERLSLQECEENSASDALNHLILCARNLSHHVTEIVNFLAINSSALFKVEVIPEPPPQIDLTTDNNNWPSDDYDDCDIDYVVLNSGTGSKPRQPTPTTPQYNKLSSKDVQLLEFYSEHISEIGPLLSQSISTFISSIQQNEPPKVFNGHLKYVILLAYKLLFAGDTVHRNIASSEVKAEVVAKADELHKSVLELHDMSKLASKHFPKILPMERIIEHVWQTTAAASQLKKVIFSATCV